jgi:hypothetical protein
MRYLLDTNILSEPTCKAPDPGAIARLKAYRGEVTSAAPAINERRYGVARLPPGPSIRVTRGLTRTAASPAHRCASLRPHRGALACRAPRGAGGSRPSQPLRRRADRRDRGDPGAGPGGLQCRGFKIFRRIGGGGLVRRIGGHKGSGGSESGEQKFGTERMRCYKNTRNPGTAYRSYARSPPRSSANGPGDCHPRQSVLESCRLTRCRLTGASPIAVQAKARPTSKSVRSRSL